MKGALIAGLVAMAFGAATSAAALAQGTKDASPGAVTTGSKAAALPAGGTAHAGMQTQSAAASNNAGVASSNARSSEKARSN